MGHNGNIEAKYATNKGVFPDDFLKEILAAFKRSKEFLDLEMRDDNLLMKSIDEIQTAALKATPEQLGQMQEMLKRMGIGKVVVESSAGLER
uniref:hypothetical protein n=1 Tax=Candidatus Nitrososphaera sp. FF02 TaxID=3398226 RepID=UPI0039EC476B